MGATVVLGAQWGDEGKGRVTDFFAETAHLVVRYQGGNNAGHTIIVGDEKFALSLIPSGVMNPQAIPVIANGCVVDPAVLLAEYDMLTGRGVDPSRLRISTNAHLIMPWHKALDEVYEGRRRLGTTLKGIGPAYQDKVLRVGLRMQDLLDPDRFRELVAVAAEERNQLLRDAFGHPGFDADEVAAEHLAMGERIAPLVTDTSLLIHRAIVDGKEVLFEGSQGTLLDLDHGTYPYVTSSNPTAGGVATGSGIGPRAIDEIVGVSKAYATRVGAGPFPTELFDDIGEQMVRLGGEFGVVTGRQRRPGWLDLVALRYAARLSSLTGIFLTKLDILSAFDEIRVAVAYEIDGERVDEFPTVAADLARAVPVYETHPGWRTDITGVRTFEDLPAEARAYVESVEAAAGVPIRWISVGPERQQAITR